MHTRLLIVVLLLISFGCKKEQQPPATGDDSAQKLVPIFNSLSSLGDYLKYNWVLQGDTLTEIDKLGRWLEDREEIVAAYFHDVNTYEIEFANGIFSYVRLIPLTKDGTHLYRGGGDQGKLVQFVSNKTLAQQKIKNNKVLILNPVVDQFYPNGYNKQNDFSSQQYSFDITVVNGDNVNLGHLDKLDEYGFIILNTHGTKRGFLLRELPEYSTVGSDWTEESVTQLLASTHSLPLDKLVSGELEIVFHIYYNLNGVVRFEPEIYVNESYIKNLSIDLSDIVLFGNHCYSGHIADGVASNNLSEAWRAKGLAAYYGYSYIDGEGIPVTNDFCVRMEDSLIKNLAIELDSTGIAHLANNSVSQYYNVTTQINDKVRARMVLVKQGDAIKHINQPLFFEHYFADDYAYDCGTFIDPRDGEAYQLACIGDQVWFAENLRWSGAGLCYNNDPARCASEGRLYSVREAMNRQLSNSTDSVKGICPEGWHIPSREEIEELLQFAGGAAAAEEGLLAVGKWTLFPNATDEFGFNIEPAPRGYFEGGNGPFWMDSTMQRTAIMTSTGTLDAVDPTFGIVDQYDFLTVNDFPGPANNYISISTYGSDFIDGSYGLYYCRCVQDSN